MFSIQKLTSYKGPNIFPIDKYGFNIQVQELENFSKAEPFCLKSKHPRGSGLNWVFWRTLCVKLGFEIEKSVFIFQKRLPYDHKFFHFTTSNRTRRTISKQTLLKEFCLPVFPCANCQFSVDHIFPITRAQCHKHKFYNITFKTSTSHWDCKKTTPGFPIYLWLPTRHSSVFFTCD